MSVENNLLFGWRRNGKARRCGGDRPRRSGCWDSRHCCSGRPSISRAARKAASRWGARFWRSPDILLLDEPLASLDAARRAEILPWLERLRDIARVPIFYVSHSLDEVARLADQVVLLDKGRVAGVKAACSRCWPGLGAEKPLGAVLEAAVRRQGRMDSRALLFDGGRLLVAEAAEKGKKVRVRIGADEILIAREAPTAISANNILPVTISDVIGWTARGRKWTMRCGSARLVARVTAASVQRLELAAGNVRPSP